jgi:hypothetical protein
LLIAFILVLAAPAFTAVPEGPITGAIFTTDSTGAQVNGNIYEFKTDVYLNGGPDKQSGPLKDGEYYVQVTDPSGATVLGTSIGSGNDTPFVVENGIATDLYQLMAILIRPNGQPGYDDTPNPGGVYKVWISADPNFTESLSKTDNFKVRNKEGGGDFDGYLNVIKYYDANLNGIRDPGEVEIPGWKVNITGDFGFTDDYTPYNQKYIAGEYVVTEYLPTSPGNWVPTTATSFTVEVKAGETTYVEFGNVCLGAGGGKTLGFWSNKNGEKLFDANDLAAMVALNLRNADGSNFDPATYAQFRTWLLSANATNMANMLSAQLAAMTLNVREGFVMGGAIVYSPTLGFISISDLIADANASLGTDGYTPSGADARDYQESLKNALDSANNNYNFVQPAPCSYPDDTWEWELPSS